MPALDWVENALILPASGLGRGPQGWIIDGGVYGADGAPVEAARHRGDRLLEQGPPRLLRDDLPVTPGRYLFGGWLQPHFGHFMVTGVGRLWPLPELAAELDGVVFLQLRGRQARPPVLPPVLRDVLACLGAGPKPPVRIIEEAERFAHLAVPEQLLLSLSEPAEKNRAFTAMLAGMARSPQVRHGLVVPKLYVSRGKLPPSLGGILFEDLLEENLAAEGYAIMYPERLSIAEQVGAYASARSFLFADGSALHLGIGFIGPDDPAAVICRRPPRSPRPGYLMAAGVRRASLIDAVQGGIATWQGETLTEHATVSAIALLDFEQLRQQLVEAGLCHGQGWRFPTEAETADRIAEAIARRERETPGAIVRLSTREEILEARIRRAAALA